MTEGTVYPSDYIPIYCDVISIEKGDPVEVWDWDRETHISQGDYATIRVTAHRESCMTTFRFTDPEQNVLVRVPFLVDRKGGIWVGKIETIGSGIVFESDNPAIKNTLGDAIGDHLGM